LARCVPIASLGGGGFFSGSGSGMFPIQITSRDTCIPELPANPMTFSRSPSASVSSARRDRANPCDFSTCWYQRGGCGWTGRREGRGGAVALAGLGGRAGGDPVGPTPAGPGTCLLPRLRPVARSDGPGSQRMRLSDHPAEPHVWYLNVGDGPGPIDLKRHGMQPGSRGWRVPGGAYCPSLVVFPAWKTFRGGKYKWRLTGYGVPTIPASIRSWSGPEMERRAAPSCAA
jgi:hypothetical protein